jgi:hypothetical protein
MNEAGVRTAAIDDLERAGRFWRPIRRPFGIAAFGVNAWVAGAVGSAARSSWTRACERSP